MHLTTSLGLFETIEYCVIFWNGCSPSDPLWWW